VVRGARLSVSLLVAAVVVPAAASLALGCATHRLAFANLTERPAHAEIAADGITLWAGPVSPGATRTCVDAGAARGAFTVVAELDDGRDLALEFGYLLPLYGVQALGFRRDYTLVVSQDAIRAVPETPTGAAGQDPGSWIRFVFGGFDVVEEVVRCADKRLLG